MKKLIYASLLILLSGSALVSCQDEDTMVSQQERNSNAREVTVLRVGSTENLLGILQTTCTMTTAK